MLGHLEVDPCREIQLQRAHICQCHILHPSTAHPNISQNKSIGKMSKTDERNMGKWKSVEDQNIQGISKVEGEKSRGHYTVWGIRDVTSVALTVKI